MEGLLILLLSMSKLKTKFPLDKTLLSLALVQKYALSFPPITTANTQMAGEKRVAYNWKVTGILIRAKLLSIVKGNLIKIIKGFDFANFWYFFVISSSSKPHSSA